MLDNIRMEGFKSFISNDILLKNLTLLAGLNNCGKSSVFQAIRMLWKCMQTGDPLLQGYGQLREIKNSKTSKSSDMKISCFSGDRLIACLRVSFEDPSRPKIECNNHTPNDLPLLCYLSADRLGPRVSLPLNTSVDILTNVGEQGEYVIDFISRHERDIIPENMRHPKSEGETLEYNIRAWLKEISPNVEFNHGIDQKRDSSYAEINNFRPTNTGFGLSYSLPIIALLLGMSSKWEDKESEAIKTTNGVLILLENPEAHLHPQGQTAMGRLISLAAASGVQVIVETHSDHIMDGIRIAIKDRSLPVDENVFHYFSLVDNLETKIETPTIYQNGKLSFWPDGFLIKP